MCFLYGYVHRLIYIDRIDSFGILSFRDKGNKAKGNLLYGSGLKNVIDKTADLSQRDIQNFSDDNQQLGLHFPIKANPESKTTALQINKNK